MKHLEVFPDSLRNYDSLVTVRNTLIVFVQSAPLLILELVRAACVASHTPTYKGLLLLDEGILNEAS